MNNQEKQLIRQAIGKCFLRVVKNSGYYLLFKDGYFKQYKLMHTTFCQDSKCKYMDTIYNFEDAALKEWANHFRDKNVYDYITVYINMLLRHFLEANGVHPRKLGMLGQEIFDLSCYQIYGQKFLDDMDAIQQKTGVRAPKNEKEACIVAEYEALTRQGVKLNFEEFMNQRLQMSDKDIFEHKGLEIPHHEEEIGEDYNDFEGFEDEYEPGN